MGLFSGISYWVGQRNLWQGRANNAWGSSRVWNSGASWETNYNSEVTLYNNEVTAYNNEVTAYNSLLNGLNSPDGLTTVAISASYNSGGSQSGATATLTIPRTGHYLIAIDCRHTVTMSSGTNGFVQNNLSGLATETYQILLTAASGVQTPCYSFVAHGDYTAGQTLSLNFTGWRGDGSATGAIYAHFVPNATYHN